LSLVCRIMNHNHNDIDENLLLQYLLGNADDISRKTVEAWLEADRGNRKHLDQLEALWLESGRLDPPPLPVDMPAAWERLSTRIDTHEADHSAPKMKSAGIRYLNYAMSAAALILLVFGIYFIVKMLTVKPTEIRLAATESIVHQALPDGSRVTLNKKSSLTYPEHFNGNVRSVKLSGEAFFEVSHDPSKPFVVDAGMAKVKVLGTMFNVSAFPNKDIEVIVTRGRVLFFTIDPPTSDTLSIILEAGMLGFLKQGSLKPEIVSSTAPGKLFWVNHTFDFNRTPLSEVFQLVKQYYGVNISVSNPDILNFRLSATFTDDPINRMMNVIAESFGLKLSVKDNNYYFSGNGCSKEVQ